MHSVKIWTTSVWARPPPPPPPLLSGPAGERYQNLIMQCTSWDVETSYYKYNSPLHLKYTKYYHGHGFWWWCTSLRCEHLFPIVKNHQLASHRSAAERNQNIVMDAIYIAEDTDLGCKLTYQITNKWLFSIPHWHWRSDFTQTTCPRYQMKPKSIHHVNTFTLKKAWWSEKRILSEI